MLTPGSPRSKFGLASALAIAWLAALPACSINVKKADNGEEKKVDIETPVGGIHVSKGADAPRYRPAVYPGAKPKDINKTGEEKSANVNISAGHVRSQSGGHRIPVRRPARESRHLLQRPAQEVRSDSRVPHQQPAPGLR